MKFDPDFHTIIIILQRYGHPFICGFNIIDCGEADIGKLSIFIFEASFFCQRKLQGYIQVQKILVKVNESSRQDREKGGSRSIRTP